MVLNGCNQVHEQTLFVNHEFLSQKYMGKHGNDIIIIIVI